MEKISFSTFQLIHQTETLGARFVVPDKTLFNSLNNKFEHRDNDSFYYGTLECMDNYLWICVEYGRAQPRRNDVVNIETGTPSINQRQSNQTELLNQSFFFYLFNNTTAYLSNSKHQNLYQQILNKLCSTNFVIKRLIINYEDFISSIKELSSISFTAHNDLFGSDGVRVRALTDLTGTSSPATFKLTASYSLKLDDSIKHFLNQLKSEQNECKLSQLVVSGIDENKLETFYNADTFTNKVPIYATRTSEGVFDSDAVLQRIKSELSI